MRYEAVIGLEIHAELKTKTKMFCYSANDPDEKHPNFNICPICMGHPGTLPVINEDAVKKVIQVGLALDGKISRFSQFDRKNYFYPDLPKGYQISQYEHPFVKGGELKLKIKNERVKIFRIQRIHLEEDTGRLIHDEDAGASLVDFNRAGVPLMELVTEPDFRTGEEVRLFGEELQRVLRYLGASDANMEKGQMRVEVNISLRQIAGGDEQEENPYGTKVEIKNINSFKYAEDAVEYEIKRQAEILDKGEKVLQETRGWNEHKEITFSQRSKEEAHDYRYFPEPDLPPMEINPDKIEKIRASIPELPEEKRIRFAKEYGLDAPIIEILVRDKALADFYESVVSEAGQHDKETTENPRKDLAKLTASFITGDFLRLQKEVCAEGSDTRISPENFAELLVYLAKDKISNFTAKEVFAEMFHSGEDPSEIIGRKGLWQMSDAGDLENIVIHTIKENPGPVEEYRQGKVQAIQFLIGRVIKETRGKGNPKLIQEIIKKKLGS